jgi:membrane-bound serine protease (ClpP class)
MLTAVGEVLDDFEGDGRIRIHGEVWNARSTVPLHKGSLVQVVAMDGLVLHVKPVTREI